MEEKNKIDRHELNAELVQRTLAGDNEAFAELVKAYYRLYYNLALGFVHDPDKAEDIVQEGLIEIHHNLGKLREPRKFYSWAYTIIRNNCYRARKVMMDESTTNMSELEQSDALKVERMISPETLDTSFELRAQHEDIIKAIYSLPFKYREVSILFFCLELNYKQISELMPINPHAAEMRIHRARKLLSDILKDYKK
jgi:RNA polymerase sigma-70 factor, ECF subfamily